MQAVHLKELIDLDQKGYLIGPDESREDFLSRVKAIDKLRLDVKKSIKENSCYSLEELKYSSDEVVPDDVLIRSQCQSKPLYHFELDYCPAFYSNLGLSFLFGGGAILFEDTENLYKKGATFSIFQIRKEFKNKPKYLIYSRDELISHESCHVARSAFKSLEYEEYFAYMASSSKFRKWFGPALWRGMDMVVLMLCISLVFVAQLYNILVDRNYFVYFASWSPFLAYLSFVGFRSCFSRMRIKKVKEKLAPLVKQPDFVLPVLFRMSDIEIHEVAKSQNINTYIDQKDEPRWSVIRARFFK